MTSTAEVRLWGTAIGAVSLAEREGTARFEYQPEFAASGIEVAPLEMPLAEAHVYRFPGLAQESFHGLPGLLADSLPDRYGNALINAWLATQGRDPGTMNAVERLCYIGRRGMGALEFAPVIGPAPGPDEAIDVDALLELASEVISQRSDLVVSLGEPGKQHALQQILRVGTSAGGARAKALIALNPKTDEVRSGQLDLDPGFEHWILKFDGIDDASRDLGSAKGYGVIEWVYAQMARDADIEMAESRLLEDNDRRHFMTRRFDRLPDGQRLHMQSLAALAHLDFSQAGAHSYEQAFRVMRSLGLPLSAVEQQFRRMVFNVVARNQDDHVKNIAFLMDRSGSWSLSPAFDVTYSYNPAGRWTANHQMSINSKVTDFVTDDLRAIAANAGMKRGRAERIAEEVTESVRQWPSLASAAGVDSERVQMIAEAHRLTLAAGARR